MLQSQIKIRSVSKLVRFQDSDPLSRP